MHPGPEVTSRRSCSFWRLTAIKIIRCVGDVLALTMLPSQHLLSALKISRGMLAGTASVPDHTSVR